MAPSRDKMDATQNETLRQFSLEPNVQAVFLPITIAVSVILNAQFVIRHSRTGNTASLGLCNVYLPLLIVATVHKYYM